MKPPLVTVHSPRSVRSPPRSPRLSGLLLALKDVIGEDPEDDFEEPEEEPDREPTSEQQQHPTGGSVTHRDDYQPLNERSGSVQKNPTADQNNENATNDDQSTWAPQQQPMSGSSDHRTVVQPSHSLPQDEIRLSSPQTAGTSDDNNETLRLRNEPLRTNSPAIPVVASDSSQPPAPFSDLLSPVELSHLHLTPFSHENIETPAQDSDSIDSGYADTWKPTFPTAHSPLKSTFGHLASPFGTTSSRVLSPRLSAFISSPFAPASTHVGDDIASDTSLDSPGYGEQMNGYAEDEDDTEPSEEYVVVAGDEHVDFYAPAQEELGDEELPEEEGQAILPSPWDTHVDADADPTARLSPVTRGEVDRALQRATKTPTQFLLHADAVQFDEDEPIASSSALDIVPPTDADLESSEELGFRYPNGDDDLAVSAHADSFQDPPPAAIPRLDTVPTPMTPPPPSDGHMFDSGSMADVFGYAADPYMFEDEAIINPSVHLAARPPSFIAYPPSAIHVEDVFGVDADPYLSEDEDKVQSDPIMEATTSSYNSTPVEDVFGYGAEAYMSEDDDEHALNPVTDLGELGNVVTPGSSYKYDTTNDDSVHPSGCDLVDEADKTVEYRRASGPKPESLPVGSIASSPDAHDLSEVSLEPHGESTDYGNPAEYEVVEENTEQNGEDIDGGASYAYEEHITASEDESASDDSLFDPTDESFFAGPPQIVPSEDTFGHGQLSLGTDATSIAGSSYVDQSIDESYNYGPPHAPGSDGTFGFGPISAMDDEEVPPGDSDSNGVVGDDESFNYGPPAPSSDGTLHYHSPSVDANDIDDPADESQDYDPPQPIPSDDTFGYGLLHANDPADDSDNYGAPAPRLHNTSRRGQTPMDEQEAVTSGLHIDDPVDESFNYGPPPSIRPDDTFGYDQEDATANVSYIDDTVDASLILAFPEPPRTHRGLDYRENQANPPETNLLEEPAGVASVSDDLFRINTTLDCDNSTVEERASVNEGSFDNSMEDSFYPPHYGDSVDEVITSESYIDDSVDDSFYPAPYEQPNGVFGDYGDASTSIDDDEAVHSARFINDATDNIKDHCSPVDNSYGYFMEEDGDDDIDGGSYVVDPSGDALTPTRFDRPDSFHDSYAYGEAEGEQPGNSGPPDIIDPAEESFDDDHSGTIDGTAQLAYLSSPQCPVDDDTLYSLYDHYSDFAGEAERAVEASPISLAATPMALPEKSSQVHPLSPIHPTPPVHALPLVSPPTDVVEEKRLSSATPSQIGPIRERVFTPPPIATRGRSGTANTAPASSPHSARSPAGPFSAPLHQRPPTPSRSQSERSAWSPDSAVSDVQELPVVSKKVAFGFRNSLLVGRSRSSTVASQRLSRLVSRSVEPAPISATQSDGAEPRIVSPTSPLNSGLRPLRLSTILGPQPSSAPAQSRNSTFSVNSYHQHQQPGNSHHASLSSTSVLSDNSYSRNPLLLSALPSSIPEHLRNTRSDDVLPSPLSSYHLRRLANFDSPRSAPLSRPASWYSNPTDVNELPQTEDTQERPLSRVSEPSFPDEEDNEERDDTINYDHTIRRPLPAAPHSAPISQRASMMRPPPMYAIATPKPTLLFAIASDDVAQVRQVLERGDAGPNDAVGPQSALAFALSNDQLNNKMEIVKTLLAFGADPKAVVHPPLDTSSPRKSESGDGEERAVPPPSLMDTVDPATRYYVERADAAHTRRTSALIHRSFFRPLTRVRYELIGQDRALEQLFKDLSIHSRQLSVTPIVVLLCGPSGHGKSLLARKCECYVGNLLDVPTHTVDMTTIHSAQDLWKSYSMSPYDPPTTRTLAEFLIDNEGKRCVVVLDEIEKTHGESPLWALLMPWEHGRCTFEANGRLVDVRNVVWLGTSNIGQELVFEHHNARALPDELMSRQEYTELMGLLRPRVSERLGASMLSRVTTALPFVPFTPQERRAICYEALYTIAGDIVATLEADVVDSMVEGALANYTAAEGARSLYRAVSNQLVDNI
ncbi:hypothetical protein H0H81_002533 [Sphagnurus paluster]|uniref:ATPase dynein-related AAA domain-containing protein n=1 Tax=Sphagnurus paluster TaxID=117069 RepID=A0A9P7FVN0_9AGAR|nr:hypothetical protein H0H81_002533 [Sphagnurus paluster]